MRKLYTNARRLLASRFRREPANAGSRTVLSRRLGLPEDLQEVVYLILAGFTVREIAEQLGCEARTAEELVDDALDFLSSERRQARFAHRASEGVRS